MGWHLIYAIEVEICLDGSMDHHAFEFIIFFWDQCAIWEELFCKNITHDIDYLGIEINGSFQKNSNHSFQSYENKQKWSMMQSMIQWQK